MGAARVPRADVHPPARLDRGLRPRIIQLRRSRPARTRVHLRRRLRDGRGGADGDRQPDRAARALESRRLRRGAVQPLRGCRYRVLPLCRSTDVVGLGQNPARSGRGGHLHGRQRRAALPGDQSRRGRQPAGRLARALPVAHPLLPGGRTTRPGPRGRIRDGRDHWPDGLHAAARDDDVLDEAVCSPHAALG